MYSLRLWTISILSSASCLALLGCTPTSPTEDVLASTKKPTPAVSANKQSLLINLPTEAQKAINLTYAVADERLLEFIVPANGEVLANSNCLARVNSPVAGRIANIKVSIGDQVRQGQVLLTITSNDIEQAEADLLQNEAQVRSDLQRDLLQIDSDINQIKAQLNLSESTFQRMSNLLEEKITSQAEFERAKTEFDKDRIQLKTLLSKRAETIVLSQERMKLLSEPLKYKLRINGISQAKINKLLKTREIDPEVEILAPETGIVSERNVNVGELIDISKVLLTLCDFHSVWLKADIYEKDIEKVELGDPIALSVDSFVGQKFRGKLNYLADSVNPETRTLTVRAEVSNPNSKLKPKMFARMNIFVGKHSVLCIPKEAIQDAGSHKVVYVPKGQNNFEERTVELGSEADGFVEILKGLKRGERVVTKGSFELQSQSFKESD